MLQLTAEGCQSRRERLIEQVDADLIIISNPRHVQYLSGFFVTSLALAHHAPVFLLIEPNSGKSTLLMQNMLGGFVDGIHVDTIEPYVWYNAKADAGVPIFPKALDALNQHLHKLTFSKAGIEIGSLPYGVHVNAVTDITSVLLEMRRHKDLDELNLIRRSITAIEAGHKAVRTHIRPGLTEIEVFNIMMSAIAKQAGHPIVPMGDIAGGERAFQGGGPATSLELQAGDLIILDIFPIINGYKGDFTTTLAVSGELTEQQAKLQKALLNGLVAGEAMLKPGNKASEVHRAIIDELRIEGFGDGFGHHAGHGLGLSHPEAPYFVPNSDEELRIGDVVTLEPGSYSPQDGYGARIEHNYLITEFGYEQLSYHLLPFA